MRIAALTGTGEFALEETDVPGIRPDEVLVRVAACGVCASELDAWRGLGSTDFPLYLGHEVSGTVEQVGADVVDLDVGARVGVWVTTRGFAEYVAVRADYCFDVGDIRLDSALAEPLACAANAVEKADVRLGDDVVIVGAGFMGDLVHQLVALRGPRQVIVADTRADALSRAAELGATCTVDVAAESLPDVVRGLTGGKGADVTFECTGTQAALATVGDVTRMSGKIVLVGFHQGPPREIPLGYWNWMAFDIVNAHFRDVGVIMRGMSIGIRLLAAGKVSIEPLVTHRFPLADIAAAFQTAFDKPAGFVKATVVMDP
jgi:2-desacetyl-2-hydroxyethyl bacteriochlorophyllide A dehydrogenase